VRFIAIAMMVSLPGALLASCDSSDNATTTTVSGSETTEPTNTTEATTTTGAEVTGPPAVPTGDLSVAIPIDPVTFDPTKALEFGDLPIVTNIYEGLLRFNPDTLELEGALATSWESSADGLEWTFHLKDGVVFQDGTPFDSSAVKATFEYYLAATTSFGALLMPQIESIDDSDPSVVVFKLTQPYGDMARNQTVIRMISPALIAQGTDAVDRNPVGTGPYQLESYDVGREVVLVANENYHGDGPYFEHLRFPIITDVSAQITALQTGQIDIMTRIPPAQVEPLGANPDLTLVSRPSWGEGYLMFHGLSENAADPQVRQAVGFAIDRELILQSVVLGQGTLADSVLPEGVYGYAVPDTVFRPDKEKVLSLLAEAGSGPGHPMKLAVSPTASGNAQAVAEAVTAQLNDAGFDATLDIVEEIVISNDQLGDDPRYDLYFTEFYWPNGGPLILASGIFTAFTHYGPDAFWELMGTADATPDSPERLALLADVQNMLANDAPVIPLWSFTMTDALRSDIHGYVPTKDGLLNSYQLTYRAQ
jgi:peptide/nickel transport system substrate-binding protein